MTPGSFSALSSAPRSSSSTLGRRAFLIALIVSAAGVGGCRGSNLTPLSLTALSDSIPAQLPGAFQRYLARQTAGSAATEGLQADLQVTTLDRLAQAFERLQTWHDASKPTFWEALWQQLWPGDQSPTQTDWVLLGDAWLSSAIAQGLIQPFDPTSLAQWSALPESWQQLVQRDAAGQVIPASSAPVPIWGAPYRWGTTAIVYRRDRFADLGWTPTDWDDLWRPELARRISLLDSDRETLGLTLKSLGQSYNSVDLAAVPGLGDRLAQLHQQALFYGSTDYLQPLLLGDTWAAVGWSSDILPALERRRELAAIVPVAGTALWADVWVRPAATPNAQSAAAPTIQPLSDLDQAWLNFCWDPASAAALSQFGMGIAPVTPLPAESDQPSDQPRGSRPGDAVRFPPAATIARSEFLLPLTAATTQQYQQFWTAMRNGSSLPTG